MRHSLAAGLLALAIAPPAWAGPVEWAQLAAIIDTLRKVHATLQDINTFVRSTRDTLNLVYPPAALREIKEVFGQVATIKDEVRELSCGWHFSMSVQRLWDGIFSGQRLCRPEWQAVFGAPPPSVFQDLDEFQDYQGVRRMNMVTSRVEAGPRNQEFLGWLLEEAEKGREPGAEEKYGPGYSQRLSAVGAAALGNVLLEQGDTLTAELELVQERVNEKRLQRKLRTELAVGWLGAMADEGLPGHSTTLSQGEGL